MGWDVHVRRHMSYVTEDVGVRIGVGCGDAGADTLTNTADLGWISYRARVPQPGSSPRHSDEPNLKGSRSDRWLQLCILV